MASQIRTAFSNIVASTGSRSLGMQASPAERLGEGHLGCVAGAAGGLVRPGGLTWAGAGERLICRRPVLIDPSLSSHLSAHYCYHRQVQASMAERPVALPPIRQWGSPCLKFWNSRAVRSFLIRRPSKSLRRHSMMLGTRLRSRVVGSPDRLTPMPRAKKLPSI